MLVDPAVIERIKKETTGAINSINHFSDGKWKARACICCDALLGVNQQHVVSKTVLKTWENVLKSSENVGSSLSQYYTYANGEEESWMDNMLLSPRAVYMKDPEKKNTMGFSCCSDCHGSLSVRKDRRTDPPRSSIANGLWIGEAPEELQCLNEAEVALVSRGRVKSHIFTFYGGCHKSIKGWHTLYDGKVEHVASTLRQLPALGVDNIVTCVLCGPFTNQQVAHIKNRVSIDCEKVVAAIKWLKANNPLYADVEIPNAEDIPPPFIIDNNKEREESEAVSIENQIDITVVFPDPSEPTVNNGGIENSEALRKRMMELHKNPTTHFELHSKPSSKILNDYEGNNLLKAFPLQFPYGIGSLPKYKGKAISKATYLDLHWLSNPNMQRPDFVLILHNIFERDRLLRSAVWKSNKMKQDDAEISDVFGEMSAAQLTEAVNNAHNGVPSGYGVGA